MNLSKMATVVFGLTLGVATGCAPHKVATVKGPIIDDKDDHPSICEKAGPHNFKIIDAVDNNVRGQMNPPATIGHGNIIIGTMTEIDGHQSTMRVDTLARTCTLTPVFGIPRVLALR